MALRDYQQAGINATHAFYAKKRYESKKGNCLLGYPTGTGKSHVIAGLIQQTMQHYPFERFVMATHDKRLIEQNANKLREAWPGVPMGVCSAGLNQRDTVQPIIFGGIGTLVNEAAMLGHRDVCIVDEAHRVGADKSSSYIKFFERLWAINPKMKIVGLTATPYRLGQGLLTDGGIFDDFAIDLTGVDAFNRFIAEGYLVPLIPRPTRTELDIRKVGIAGGELKQDQLQKAVDIYEVTYAALQEAVEIGQDRNCWLAFASGIEHAEHIAEILNDLGISAVAVHSGLDDKTIDFRIEQFKIGAIRCLVNYKMLTTGFDHPPIDLILDLYPTVSPGMHVQKNGRGTRPVYAPGFNLNTIEGRLAAIAASCKRNCMVLDYAGNVPRLGPINDPKIPKKKGPGTGDVPIRICASNGLKINQGKQAGEWVKGCGTYNHASARQCIGCGHEFSFAVKISATAHEDAPIKPTEMPVVEFMDVMRVEYLPHTKPGGLPQIRVVYHGAFQRFSEFVNFESPVAYVKHKAHEWFRQRYPLKENELCPELNSQVLQICSQLRTPKKIRVHANKKPYPEILSHEY